MHCIRFKQHPMSLEVRFASKSVFYKTLYAPRKNNEAKTRPRAVSVIAPDYLRAHLQTPGIISSAPPMATTTTSTTEQKMSKAVSFTPTPNNLRLFGELGWPDGILPYSVKVPEGWTLETENSTFVITESKHRLQLRLLENEFYLACPAQFEQTKIDPVGFRFRELGIRLFLNGSHVIFDLESVPLAYDHGFMILNDKNQYVCRLSQGSMFRPSPDVYGRACFRLGPNLNPIRIRNLTEYLGCTISADNRIVYVPKDILEFTTAVIKDIVTSSFAPKAEGNPEGNPMATPMATPVETRPVVEKQERQETGYVSNADIYMLVISLRDEIRALRREVVSK